MFFSLLWGRREGEGKKGGRERGDREREREMDAWSMITITAYTI